MRIIYCYTNLINNKKYIGQTNNLKRRIKQHRVDSYHNYDDKRYNQIIHQAIRKYGIENFQIEVLEDNISDEQIDEKEQYYIKKYNTMAPNGYNMTEGGLANKTAPVPSKISEEEYNQIVKAIENNMSFKNIALKFNVSYSYISDINNGSRLFHQNIQYPIRKSINNPDKEYYQKIIDKLKSSSSSQAEIANELNISKTTVQRVNTGNIKKLRKLFPDLVFPIRNR